MRRARTIIVAAGLVAVGVTTMVGMILLLAQGLDKADKLATVFGFFLSTALGVSGLVLGWLTWRQVNPVRESFPAPRPRPDTSEPASTPSVGCTLPAGVTTFIGRVAEVEEITSEALAAVEARRELVVHAIDGMPGVGKTALAVHVGWQLKDRFPDRQLFLDLHAHTAGQRPTHPGEALGTLLAADGVDARHLPDDPDERAAMWRARMADRRALLILDNAAESRQVAPLLPDAAGCLVVVTSRRHLGDLPRPVVGIPLDVLPPDEALKMFLALAPRAAGHQWRAARLVELCGRLPLAISLLARLFARHTAWGIGDLVSETKTRLLTVKAENSSVVAAFDLSISI